LLFRKATLEDAPELVALLREIGWFEALERATDEEAIGQVRTRLEQCLADDSHTVYVARAEDGGIAGYVSVHWLPYLFMRGPEGYVSELFVRPAARGRGVGRKLLELVQTEARPRGCARLSLINLRQRESYQRQFYVKGGWKERGEAANFIFTLS
jgi:GNAT superfamily N-acetyltransferase